MNPFDYPGPQFLAFYFVLAIVVIAVATVKRRNRELELAPRRAPRDGPYLIAFLRAGKDELLRVAVMSLVDRGLLSRNDQTFEASATGRQLGARRPIERELLAFCETPRQAEDFFTASFPAVQKVERELQDLHLLPGAGPNSVRRPIWGAAALILLFFSVTKIVVAIQRGRTNVIFLVLLTIAALIIANLCIRPRLTAAGSRMLSELQNLFASLRLRANQIAPGGATSELVLFAAVFGGSALAEEHRWITRFGPPAQTAGDVSGSSCGSSSCGSSCGGSCGGGCGGCGS
jgi:uncharacterized protein (TIGR04222 family)